jgi:hypothetical protein
LARAPEWRAELLAGRIETSASVADVSPTLTLLRALAAISEQLHAQVVAVQAMLRGARDEPSCRVGWRLADAAGGIRDAAEAMATATDRAFIGEVRGRPHCFARWGCCPDHGATLSSSGGRCWCTALGCDRSWSWDRIGLPCDEPPAFRLVDAAGKEGLVCAGHAVAVHRQMSGARLLPLRQTAEGRGCLP